MKALLMHVLLIKHSLLTKRDSQTKTYVTTTSKCDMSNIRVYLSTYCTPAHTVVHIIMQSVE